MKASIDNTPMNMCGRNDVSLELFFPVFFPRAGGIGDVAPHGSGGLGAEGGSLGNGRYVARLSEGRESSGRVEESTLLNLLFVPDGR